MVVTVIVIVVVVIVVAVVVPIIADRIDCDPDFAVTSAMFS